MLPASELLSQDRVIIFDFDGTLVDTLDAVVAIANKLAPKYEFDKVKPEDVTRLRQESPFQILRQYHISPLKIPAILAEGKSEFTKIIGKVNLVKGIVPVLETLEKKEYILGILTTNSRKNIEIFLKKNNLSFFDFIQGDIGIFGKKRGLQKVLSERGLKQENVVYVGDEIRDIDAARHAGITSVAVSWGFNTHDFLSKHKPDFLVDSPHQLLKIFN